MKLPSSISICEVGLRDGLQNEKTLLTVEQKIELLTAIQNAGVKTIEVGSMVNPKAVPQMAGTEEVFEGIEKLPDVDYRVLVLNMKGLERAESCGINKAKLTVSASATHQLKNANKTHAQMFEQFGAIAESAKEAGVTLSGAISTSFGCPFEGVMTPEKVALVAREFVNIGVTELSLSDTTGMANPKQVYELCSEMQEMFPDIMWNLHFHNTRNMGFANVFAGMQAGITRFDASLGGLGGCPFAPGATGNIATEDLVHMCGEMGIETGIDIDMIIAEAKKLRDMMGIELPSAILKAGKNSDLHRA